MKNLKHSKYKNTAILFEILVRKLTSESLTSDKSVTINIIKKYFGKNTELSKELQLYNSLIKEQLNSEAKALEFVRTCKSAHLQLNKSVLKRQRYNLVKEISENFDFNKISKIRINNYKTLASVYKIFEYNDIDNPNQLFECKNEIVAHMLIQESSKPSVDKLIEAYKAQNTDTRLLAYKLMIDKFNKTHVNDTEQLKQYFGTVIPSIKKELKESVTKITDPVTKIKVDNLSKMLCNIESIKLVKESHVLSLLRYYDLLDELTKANK